MLKLNELAKSPAQSVGTIDALSGCIPQKTIDALSGPIKDELLRETIASEASAYRRQESTIAEFLATDNLLRKTIASESSAYRKMLDDSSVYAAQAVALKGCIGDLSKSYLEQSSAKTALKYLEKSLSSTIHIDNLIGPRAYQKMLADSSVHAEQALSNQLYIDKYSRPIFLANDLIEALDEGNEEKVEKIVSGPEFGSHVLLAMLDLARKSDEDREATILAKTEELIAKNNETQKDLDAARKEIERLINSANPGVKAMKEARTVLTDGDKKKIKEKVAEKKKNNARLSDGSIYESIAKEYECSASTIRRACLAK